MKRYTLFNFLVDAGLTVLTGGIWLIWIFIREMRNH
jgi:ABC-type enterobactin transport system permease subunit